MQNGKRDRCVNWEKEEKQLLKSILRPYMAVIENKDLNTNTNKDKLKAWCEITEKFNVANVRQRDKKQIINQWKCIKLNSKKEMSSYRRETSKTGGGPKPPSPSPETVEVADMIPQEFEVDFNEYDCDGIQDLQPEVIVEIVNDIKNEQPENAPKKPSKKGPKERKETSSFRLAEATYADMHNYRALENERLQKEHELRLTNMAEIHTQVMVNLRLQTEILNKTLESFNKNKE